MTLIVMILVLTSIKSLQTLNLIEQDQFDVLEGWGITRAKREHLIKKKFPEHPVLSCDMLYQTKEAPFTAIILYKTSGRLLCMGSIIDHYHILSCKLCFEKTDVSDLRVLVGYYKAWWGAHAQIYKVSKIIRHEYHVALLRLKAKIRYTDYVQAARLPSTVTKMELDMTKMFPPPYFVVGFFVDRYDVPGDFIEKDQTYKIKEDQLTPFDDCRSNYSKLVLDAPKLFCVLGNATYCWGGWGAPVLFKQSEYYLQVGVVIHDNCTSDSTGPFLVARTDVFGEWIRGNSFHGHQPQ